MDTTIITKDTFDSDEYRAAKTALDYSLVLLKRQIKTTLSAMSNYEDIRKSDRDLHDDKPRPELVSIMYSPVYTYHLYTLLDSIDKHFKDDEKWKEEYRAKTV